MSSNRIGSEQWFDDVLTNPNRLYEGGRMMVDGMKYHASKYLGLENQLLKLLNPSPSRDSEDQRKLRSSIIREMKYELIAYINQMGLFYYFVRGNRVKEKIGDSLKQIPTIDTLLFGV